jgi:hypothetical protein
MFYSGPYSSSSILGDIQNELKEIKRNNNNNYSTREVSYSYYDSRIPKLESRLSILESEIKKIAESNKKMLEKVLKIEKISSGESKPDLNPESNPESEPGSETKKKKRKYGLRPRFWRKSS